LSLTKTINLQDYIDIVEGDNEILGNRNFIDEFFDGRLRIEFTITEAIRHIENERCKHLNRINKQRMIITDPRIIDYLGLASVYGGG
jgi:hypothetical protein